MSAYVYEIRNIEAEIKRLSSRASELRKKKHQCEENLYNYMVAHNLQKVENINISKVTPKQTFRKNKTEKKRDALRLFRDIGIPDPEGFWKDFQSTQKVVLKLNEEDA
jgi:hypothetical protein